MDNFFANLPEGHVLKTFYLEHEILLKTLNEISELNDRIQNIQRFDSAVPELKKLQYLATRLTDSEPHHQREENALFPIMIERGMGGPPAVMTMEHVTIREYKHKLRDISVNYKDLSWEEVKTKINSLSIGICQILGNHIQKENTILYPMAYQGIPEESVWQEMKKKCDEIGYCSFTPGQVKSS